jgi:N-acetyl-anhydromuramyl-L-alanine amidase AmpD
MKRIAPLLIPLLAIALTACRTSPAGRELRRSGDEIVIAGRHFHTGAPVVLWTDPGGYDAYRTERRFVPWDRASWEETSKVKGAPATPARYSLRAVDLSPDELERVRGGGWDLPLLQRHVDQFVIHYDVCGTSRRCFQVLHDLRGLSVHFMLDIDGTIYQTLDVKERAWHATICNDRSVGVEIANIGAYAFDEKAPFAAWYQREPAPGRPGTVGASRMRVTIPPAWGDGGVRTPNFIGYAARPEIVVGDLQGRTLRQYDLTPQQYDSLAKLTATLCIALPRIGCDAPRDASGTIIPGQISEDSLKNHHGLLGHYHIQKEKVDPGPAFDWERVISDARRIMSRRGIDWRGRSSEPRP